MLLSRNSNLLLGFLSVGVVVFVNEGPSITIICQPLFALASAGSRALLKLLPFIDLSILEILTSFVKIGRRKHGTSTFRAVSLSWALRFARLPAHHSSVILQWLLRSPNMMRLYK